MPQDIILGNKDAPVTFLEYSSLSCPMCAILHEELFPELKTRYIDRGLVKYIHRNYPLNESATCASMLLLCGGKEKYYLFLDSLFRTQSSWATTSNYRDVIINIGQLGGLSSQFLSKCLMDEKVEKQLLKSRLDANNILEVKKTPTIFINGVKMVGVDDKKQIFKVIEEKLEDGSKK